MLGSTRLITHAWQSAPRNPRLTIHASQSTPLLTGLSCLFPLWNRSGDCQHIIASGEGCNHLITDIVVCAYLKAAAQGSDSYLITNLAT